MRLGARHSAWIAAEIEGSIADTIARSRAAGWNPDDGRPGGRARCRLLAAGVILTAIHTHGGPATLTGLRGGVDPAYMRRLADDCADAID